MKSSFLKIFKTDELNRSSAIGDLNLSINNLIDKKAWELIEYGFDTDNPEKILLIEQLEIMNKVNSKWRID